MVKLKCGFCSTDFECGPNEIWRCPSCEEAYLCNIVEISPQEIDCMYSGLDTRDLAHGGGKILIPDIVRTEPAVYVSVESKESADYYFRVLPLLFDRVFMRGAFFATGFDDPPGSGNNLTTSLLESKVVVPVGYSTEEIIYSDMFHIWTKDIMNYPSMTNLVSALSSEDLDAMISSLEPKSLDRLKANLAKLYGRNVPGPYSLKKGSNFDYFDSFRLGTELEKYNFDLLATKRMDLPFILEPAVEEIHQWKMNRVAELYESNFNKETTAIKKFFETLRIDVPTRIGFDEINSFRKDKASEDFRQILFFLSKNLQASSSFEVTQGLLSDFYEKSSKFNELANSYADTVTMFVTGAVSTLGGLMSGVPGAIVGGIGAGAVSPLTKGIFKKIYTSTRHEWVNYIVKWKSPKKRAII